MADATPLTMEDLLAAFNEAGIAYGVLVAFLKRAAIQYQVDSLGLQIQGMDQAQQAANAATEQAKSILREQINSLNQSLVPVV
jgi:cell division protein FtsB